MDVVSVNDVLFLTSTSDYIHYETVTAVDNFKCTVSAAHDFKCHALETQVNENLR